MCSGLVHLLPRSSRRGRFLQFGLLGATIVLAGCSSAPTPTTYDLTAPAAASRHSNASQILVQPPAAIAVFAGQQIVVKDAAGTVASLGNGQWADELPALIQARLIHTFENASRLRAVARPSSGAVADAQLISEIRAFQIETPANEAFVELSAKLVSDRTGRILNGRLFRTRVPVAAVDAPNAARALDEALSVVMLDIVRWVSTTAIPSRDAPET
jgi:cholesterol transport system auxiliary component